MRLQRISAAALATLLAVGAPAFARAATSDDPTTSMVEINPELASMIDAADGGPVGVIVHGVDYSAVTSALADADLPVLVEFPRIDAAATVATGAQLEALASAPGIEHLEADAQLDYFGDTSHTATRGQELLDGYTVTVANPEPKTNPEDDGLGLGDGNGQGNAEGHDKDNSNGDADGKAQTNSTWSSTIDVPVQADGSGVSIAIIDSGVDGTHPMFEDLDAGDGSSRVKVNLKFAPLLLNPRIELPSPTNDTDTVSAGGHGTHVAGIAAGGPMTLEDGRTIHGAAPKATIISLSAGAGISVAAATQAQYWVLENWADPCGDASCPPIRVVNNSYGPRGGGDFDVASATVEIQRQLAAEGVVMAWAAGNDGGAGVDNRSNPPGQDPTPGILMVANYDDGDSGTRDGVLASSSSRGLATRQKTWPDISAPGTAITSACRPALTICSSGEGDAGTISGTSMATPHVAGIVAQLFQLAPEATPAQVEDAIEDSAHQFTFGGAYFTDFRNADHTSSFDKGHGLIDAVAAANDLLGLVEATGAVGAAECRPEDPYIVDPAGDGFVQPLVENPVAPPSDPESDPGIDIRQVDIVPTADGLDVIFTMEDVTGQTPQGTDGYTISLRALMDGTPFSVSADLSGLLPGATGLDPTTEASYSIDYIEEIEGTSNSTGIVSLDGETNTETDQITVHVTDKAIEDHNDANDENAETGHPDVPRIVPGLRWSGLAAESQTRVNVGAGSLLIQADTASALCDLRYGEGAVTAAPPSETPDDNDSGVDPDGNPVGDDGGDDGSGSDREIDGESTLAAGDSASFDGASPLHNPGLPFLDEGYECTGFEDPNCPLYLLHIGDAGELAFWVEAGFVEDDFDLALYDGDGDLVGVYGAPLTPPLGLEGGVEAVTAGDYYVQVQPYFAYGPDSGDSQSSFTLYVDLS